MEINKIYHEPCLDTLRKMPDNFIDCVITSPPYWQLRDYGYVGQWGLEPTFQEYLAHLWEMMDEIKRVLKPTGTCWINLGDTYGGSWGNYGTRKGEQRDRNSEFFNRNGALPESHKPATASVFPKSQLLLPHRFAIGCIDRGWIVRNDIIWGKRNGMPESVKDRFSKKHEYIFFMVKNEDYFFDLDAIREKHKDVSLKRIKNSMQTSHPSMGMEQKLEEMGERFCNPKGKNPGSVSDFWDITTKPSSNKHYASYNWELLKYPILAGCPGLVCAKCGTPKRKRILSESTKRKREANGDQPGGNGHQTSTGWTLPSVVGVEELSCGCWAGFQKGLIYDPFSGSGSTPEAALRANRSFIGSEMSGEYVDISNRRLRPLLAQDNLF